MTHKNHAAFSNVVLWTITFSSKCSTCRSVVKVTVDDVRDIVPEESHLLLAVVNTVFDVIDVNPDVVELVFRKW